MVQGVGFWVQRLGLRGLGSGGFGFWVLVLLRCELTYAGAFAQHVDT